MQFYDSNELSKKSIKNLQNPCKWFKKFVPSLKTEFAKLLGMIIHIGENMRTNRNARRRAWDRVKANGASKRRWSGALSASPAVQIPDCSATQKNYVNNAFRGKISDLEFRGQIVFDGSRRFSGAWNSQQETGCRCPTQDHLILLWPLCTANQMIANWKRLNKFAKPIRRAYFTLIPFFTLIFLALSFWHLK